MTVHTPRILTEGETALFEAFDKAKFGGHKAAREAAIEALKDSGLPTRRVEAFHYTDLRALLSGPVSIAPRPDDDTARAIGVTFPKLVENAAVAHYRDGHYFDWGQSFPDGVTVTDDAEPAEPVAGAENAVALINTAFATGSAKIDVAAGTEVDQVIGIAHAQTSGENSIAAITNHITVGAGASCEIIDRAIGSAGSAYLSSAVVNLELADGAKVAYILSNEEGDAARRLAQLNVTLGKDASLELFVLNLGGKLVRQEINFDVLGEGANLDIYGINLIGGDAHIDVTSRITHHVPNTTANEIFRNVATGRGRGVFQGQINVSQPAQLTDARMACNTLLLSDDCDFSAKPELEIFADDVQCAHGATVADLEESHLFYLMARGISEREARGLLIRAFVAEVVEELEDEALVETLEERIDAWMDVHV